MRAESLGEGRGATFTLRLPVAAAPSDGPATAPRPAMAGDYPRLDNVHVLIVEDDADSARVFESLVTACGAKAAITRSVAEALEVHRRWKIDVLISDIGMPQEDGYVLIRKIREREHRAGSHPLPAIAVTAYARPEDRDQALAAGFQVHVAKPVEPVDLLETIARLAAPRRSATVRPPDARTPATVGSVSETR